jgi:oligopeptide transport system substrate-binding protein
MRKSFGYLSILLILAMLLGACAPAATPAPATIVPPTVAVATAEAPAATAPPAAVPTATTAPVASPQPTTAAPAAPKIISGAFEANDPRSIDPQRAIDTRDWAMLTPLFPSLVIMTIDNQKTLPDMAKSWEVSSDGLVYTFHLMDKVPWVHYNKSSGAVEEVKDDSGSVRYVTANDFVYGFMRALDPTTGSPAAYMLSPYIVGAADFNAGKGKAEAVGIKAIDNLTLQITAPEKVGFALSIYSIINARATPEWAIKASGDAWTEPENINSFGPYALKAWEHEASLTYIKNPFWPGAEGVPQSKLDEVNLRFIDETVGLREFEAGNLDFTLVPGDQIERLKVDAKLSKELTLVPGVCTQAWGFNTKKAPFDNIHIRRAFNFAVDRQTLVDSVLNGGQVPAVFFTPPSIALAPSATDAAKSIVIYDPAKAKEELALGLKDLNLASADKLPQITVEFGNAQELSAVAQALQAMWQETLGVKVELAQVDNTVYWSKQEKDAAQIFRAGWCPDYNDANNYLRDNYRSDSIYNYGKFTNAEYDKLVDDARMETDPAVRLKEYTRAETIMNIEDAGIMTLYYPVRAQLTQPKLQRDFSFSGVEYFWNWDITQ